MGYFLDQCASDAWDVINGRKKIIGNKIIDCRENNNVEIKNMDGLHQMEHFIQ